jgi:UDP-N-acetylmuramoylalanine--D-glutamate ligase
MRRRYEPLQFDGRKVLVMGLGTRQGGAGVARYLARQRAEVVVTDLRPEAELASTMADLEDLPIRYTLGEHREADFDWAELVVRNPGVLRNSPWLERARRRGVPIEMEMSLFFRACPAPIIGITGTKGKTSTATLCAGMLRQMRSDTVLAGNMGTSALDQLPRITSKTPVVLELSSWQLEGLAPYEMSPEFAVLTNISEDHLNRYDSMADYIEAKRHIIRFQQPGDWFIVNRGDPVCWGMTAGTPARVIPFGDLGADQDGAGHADGVLYWRMFGETYRLIEARKLPIRGAHVIENCLAATGAAIARGASIEHVCDGVLTATPVPHRQELVEIIDGVEFINDTTATAPAAAIAALRTFADRPIVLIAGGAGKGASLQAFAEAAAATVRAIVLLDGDATENLRALLAAAGARNVSAPQQSMEEAIRLAVDQAEPGGVVLLSPACASFGLFRDEFHRGAAFREAVQALAKDHAGGLS